MRASPTTRSSALATRAICAPGPGASNPGAWNNTATSPLNVVVLAAAGLLTGGEQTWAALLVFAASLLAATLFLRGWTERLGLGALLGEGIGLALFAWPFFQSTIGLETPLVVLTLAASLWAWSAGRGAWMAFALGLSVAARPDMALVALLGVCAGLATRTIGPRALVWVPAIPVAWLAVSWRLFHSLVPATLAIKRASAWREAYLDGLGSYATFFPSFHTSLIALGALALAAGAVAIARRTRPAKPVLQHGAFLLLSAVAYSIAYQALRVPPFFWYYAFPLLCALLLSGLLLGCAIHQLPARWPYAAVLIAAPALASLAEERLSDHWQQGQTPVSSNWSAAGTYEQAAAQIARLAPPGASVYASEVGTLGYYLPGRTMLDNEGIAAPVDGDVVARLRRNLPAVIASDDLQGWPALLPLYQPVFTIERNAPLVRGKPVQVFRLRDDSPPAAH